MIDFLQWPAMAATVLAAWMSGSQSKRRRQIAFWCFLVSNAMWAVWAWHAHAWALIVLQVFLAVTNVRGVKKNE